VEDIQHQSSNGDHDALEPDKEILASHKGTGPSLGQLGDAVDATPEDADESQGQGAEEGAEHDRGADLCEGGGLVEGGGAETAMARPGAPGEVASEEHEYEHCDDLGDKAGDHDVVAGLGVFAVCGEDGGHGAADGLEDEGDEVAGDELDMLVCVNIRSNGRKAHDASVPLGLDAGVIRAKGVDDLAQGEVDAGGEEGRADGEAADLHEEDLVDPLVLVGDDAACVAEDFAEDAEEHGDEEGEAAAGEGVGQDVEEGGEGEDGDEGDVGGQVNAVTGKGG
jgi:hypothetical protein